MQAMYVQRLSHEYLVANRGGDRPAGRGLLEGCEHYNTIAAIMPLLRRPLIEPLFQAKPEPNKRT